MNLCQTPPPTLKFVSGPLGAGDYWSAYKVRRLQNKGNFISSS